MRILVWDLPTRVFHWLLVAAFALAYVTGEGERFMVMHGVAGYTVLGLIAFRLLWGIVGSRYARFRSFAFGPRAVLDYLASLIAGHAQRFVGHNPAGGWVIFALMALVAATSASGWLMLGADGERFEDLHEALANATLALIALHVAGAVVSSWLHRENLVRAMVDGQKEGSADEGLSGSVWIVGLVVAALAAAFWTAALRGDLPAVTDSLKNLTYIKR